MARLRRMPCTKPLPPGAEIVTHKGKPHARIQGDGGRTALAPLTKKGDRIRLLAKKRYGEYRDADGVLRCEPLSADKTAAQQMLAGLVNKAELGKVGIRDPFERHSTRPLLEHLDDYRRHLEAAGDTPGHVVAACSRAGAVLRGCGFTLIADLDPEKVAGFLHGLRRDPPRPGLPPGQEWFTPRELGAALGGRRPAKLARLLRSEGLGSEGNGRARRYPRATVEALQGRVCRGIGISTSNCYLTAVKGFARWLFEKERTDRDRLVSLSRLNAGTDPRHERRALTEPELRAVLEAAGRSEAVFGGLAGRDRAMLYALAMTTGYRVSELASLSPAAFDLGGRPPTATVKAAYSKNRRKAVQPLPAEVVEALRGYLAGPPASPSGPGPGTRTPPRCCGRTSRPPASRTGTARAGWPTSTPCGTATSPCWSGPASARSWPRNWPATPTSG